IKNTRVLEPRPSILRLSQFPCLDDYEKNNHKLWKHYMRIPVDVFYRLLEKIRPHPIFYNNSNNAQLDIKRQLQIFLYRVGIYGNGGSLESVAG
ncbi:hypothetical protein BDW22DRAFT_1468820, partial [Trametopsis cervina]